MSQSNPSIGFLIASIGHATLTNTLRSLYGQFNHGVDKIYLFFDGKCDAGFNYFQAEYDLYGSDMIVTMLPINLGYFGHGIRNAYQHTLSTDYIHHMDDDDAYAEGAMHQVRADLHTNNYGKLFMYKFRSSDRRVLWEQPKISFGQIGTPSGIIPNKPELFGHWGEGYGGDFDFYKTLQDGIGIKNVIFRDVVIVKCRPHILGM